MEHFLLFVYITSSLQCTDGLIFQGSEVREIKLETVTPRTMQFSHP